MSDSLPSCTAALARILVGELRPTHGETSVGAIGIERVLAVGGC
ncbi:MAG TPA: hypothetical protein VF192_06080 [Longimicrobiales bacterium]